jgi:NAD(P)-dependent dehydrogenase (short-subunit alcohol dehydrogenase family)
MKLQNKVALVTGAAQGIGLACAERLIAEGAQVMLADIDSTRLKEVTANLPGAQAESCLADSANADSIHACVNATVHHFGRIDILVNNAGIVHAADFLDLRIEDFDRVMAVNLRGYFLYGQAVARHMVAKGIAGSIINMSSANAVVAIPNQIPYVVSKGAVNQLTKVMAVGLAHHGIRVNGVGPGTIGTELARNAVLGSEEARRKILSRTPLGRLGEPHEVAAVVAFLASEDASYLTGQTLYPDGGRLALNYTVPVKDGA